MHVSLGSESLKLQGASKLQVSVGLYLSIASFTLELLNNLKNLGPASSSERVSVSLESAVCVYKEFSSVDFVEAFVVFAATVNVEPCFPSFRKPEVF